MKTFLICAAITACAFAAIAQTPNPQTTATIHIYRIGSHGNAIQILADGVPIFKLKNRQAVTFALMPGHHQIGAAYAHEQPILTMTLAPGAQYYIELAMNARHSALFTGNALGAIVLTFAERTELPSGLHEQKLSAEEESDILSRVFYAHPQVIAAAPIAPTPATAVASASTTPALPTATVASASTASAQTIVQQSYRVKYAGGTVPGATVGRKLSLIIGSADIVLGPTIIPSHSVTSIVLSQDKHHRIGTGIAISMVTLGAGIPVMFSKSTKDFIQITWNSNGQTGGAAFQADKNEYRGILAALEGVTGKTATMGAPQ